MHPFNSVFRRRSLGTRRFPRRSNIDRASSPRATAMANSSHRPRKSFLPASKEVRTIRCRTIRSLDVDTMKTRKLPAKNFRSLGFVSADTRIYTNSFARKTFANLSVKVDEDTFAIELYIWNNSERIVLATSLWNYASHNCVTADFL